MFPEGRRVWDAKSSSSLFPLSALHHILCHTWFTFIFLVLLLYLFSYYRSLVFSTFITTPHLPHLPFTSHLFTVCIFCMSFSVIFVHLWDPVYSCDRGHRTHLPFCKIVSFSWHCANTLLKSGNLLCSIRVDVYCNVWNDLVVNQSSTRAFLPCTPPK